MKKKTAPWITNNIGDLTYYSKQLRDKILTVHCVYGCESWHGADSLTHEMDLVGECSTPEQAMQLMDRLYKLQ